ILGRLAPDTHDHLRSIIAAALGDEEAWVRVTDRFVEQVGPLVEARLGIPQSQLPALARSLIEPLLTPPFGDVQLSSPLLGRDAAQAEGTGLGVVKKGPNARDDVDLSKLEFDRGMFLLAKQLLCFERYGKMYLSDVSLVSDREFFEALIA